jgi:pyruvate,water dikinase
VAELIKQCEAHFGMPIDTEWAFAGGKLYLRQARPITS